MALVLMVQGRNIDLPDIDFIILCQTFSFLISLAMSIDILYDSNFIIKSYFYHQIFYS